MTKLHHRILFFALFQLCHSVGMASANYNSVMIGGRAGGMGGAFTALTDDPAADAYYNPATLARLDGSSLSAAVSLFNKYDVSYGQQGELDQAIFRINKGSILSIPAASGIFSSFRSFSAGLSILIPDYQVFGGNVYTKGDDSTFLRIDDQTLWVGGAMGFNMTDTQSLGLSIYYTSQSSTRSLTNRYFEPVAAETIVFNEEKTYSVNSFVYILGYYKELSERWRFGTSYRFSSIPVASHASYLQSEIGTVSGASPVIQRNDLRATGRIPDRTAVGIAYSDPGKTTVSFDLTYFGGSEFNDINLFGDRITQRNVLNGALGIEHYFEPWIALRLGFYTDRSASPKIPKTPQSRYQDHIDKYGFSANVGLHTTEHTTLSLGGYYLGGNGTASERIGAGYQRIDKTDRLFSFLVGSAYNF